MIIPIQNIYYLLSYAWNKAEISLESPVVGQEAGENVVNLLASMLLPETRKLIKQGLAAEYITQTRQINGIKGKLLLNETFRLNQKAKSGQAICMVEELSPNILPNQILKTTLLQLQHTVGLVPNLKKEVEVLLSQLAPVQTLAFNFQILKKMPVPRHQQERYQFILNCCILIRENLLPVSDEQEFAFKSFLSDKKQMAVIFEAFVRNFYRLEQSVFQVRSEKINWLGQGTTEEAQDFLPVMLTDISLESAARKIIIDTKFYGKALLPHYQNEKLHSKHLYQLFTYLHNSPVNLKDQALEGMLLYPVVNKVLNLEYTLSGKKVRICTINLNQPWPGIKQDLLQLLF
ncbi:5-methylcytosine restriction system specificity protein McrC [Adhaeribacter pallidiroseus]|uniref:Protein McrC n=1 Tax=Adhaeribacter pallidiroseus TaxID=2072847 RepID=A0A369QEU2_9BACT|nr:hypothetical protein [Adhaeribacter pallidiroseus]RDC61767.1 Protein McrC [Adhaeribacter pallidiroseus]